MIKPLTCIAVCTVLCFLAGCDKNKDEAPAETKTEAKPKEAQKTEKPALDVAGQWSGRWESTNAKGHGGGLTCAAAAKGADEWEATFTAEFGRIKAYTIPLKGKREGDKVVFGGEVNIGKDKGEGVFKWTGHADAKEFVGEYEGGGDKGTFKMERAAKK